MNNLFEEHQNQHSLLPWLFVTFIWAVSIWHIYNNGLSKENLALDVSILLLLPLAITLLLFLFKLSVKIDKNYLMFKMFPFHWKYKKIKLDEINNVTVKEYNKDRLFHGWGLGISWSRKYKSYTVKGYNGVEISLNDGKKLFIGTQQPETFVESLNIG
jgi:hypothetical protein